MRASNLDVTFPKQDSCMSIPASPLDSLAVRISTEAMAHGEVLVTNPEGVAWSANGRIPSAEVRSIYH